MTTTAGTTTSKSSHELENDRLRETQQAQQAERDSRREHTRLVLTGLAALIVVLAILSGIGLLVHTLRVPPSVFTERQATCLQSGGTYVHLEGQSEWTCLRPSTPSSPSSSS